MSQNSALETIAKLLEATADYEAARSKEASELKAATEEAKTEVITKKLAEFNGITVGRDVVEKLSNADPVIREFIEKLSNSASPPTNKLGEPEALNDSVSEKIASEGSMDSADRKLYNWILGSE